MSGGVWSHRHGVMFAGNIDRIEEEIAEIKEEQEDKRKAEIQKQAIKKGD